MQEWGVDGSKEVNTTWRRPMKGILLTTIGAVLTMEEDKAIQRRETTIVKNDTNNPETHFEI